MPSPVTVRDCLDTDESAWRHLWSGYNSFYDTTVPETVTAHTWKRIRDSSSTISCRLACVDDFIAGFSISVLHEGTWTLTPICYLEDLFVDPQFRGRGIGRLLIRDLVDRAKINGWSRLYWHTRVTNSARRLYDEFVQADDFVRYRMCFEQPQ